MILSRSTPNGKSIKKKELAAEAQIARLDRLASDITQRIDGKYLTMDESLWAEAARLSAVAFDITSALARDDIEEAYRISDADQHGEVLGVAV